MAQAREVALDHYDKVQSYVDGAALVAGQAWDQVDPDHLVDSWMQQLPSLTQAVAGAQYGAASLADGYVDDALEAQDLPPASVAPVDPAGFAGVASDGRGLASLMTNPVIQVLTSIPIPGVTVPQAMAAGRANLDMLVRTQVSDAGRLADQVSLTAHPAADGYTRIAVGGSCSRCLILAGKFYRWNTGFARHPWCDCKHVPTKEADAKGLIRDPYDIYRSMSAQERLRAGFTLGDQRALAEGADINQVVNARRGVYVAGGRSLTREGTTRRALFGGYEIDPETGRILARRAKGAAVKQRLTPDQIFAEAETRADALRMLHENGYLAERPSAALSEADRLRLATRDEQGQAILRGSPLAESPAPTGAAAAAEGTVTHIDDLPRLENPDDRLAVARGTNPRYAMAYEGPFTPDMAGTGVGYTQNCTRVAITYEMRRRGFAVTAGAGQTIGDTSAAYIRTFRLDGHYATRVAEDLSHKMTAREVAAEVESWPRGGRGIIVVQGHTLNVERDLRTGRAVFVDAQSARVKNPVMTVDRFEKRLRERGAPTDWVGVARVDDLELSDYGLRYVESPELSLADGHVGRTEWPTPEPGRMASFEEIARLTPDDTYGAALPAKKAAPAKKATAPPAKKAPAAPKPPTLAALRKQVTDAGITIPAGAPRAVVENLVDALERGVAPARAREAAVRELTELRGMVGDKLAQTAAALENGASDRAMAYYARQLRRLSSGEGGVGFPARAVPELGKPLQGLIDALERGDAAAARAALPKAVTGSKLKALGTPGSVVARSKLGSDLEWVGAGRGDVVEVLHPGYSTTLEGRMVTVTKPSIRSATPEQAQAFRQPTKAAKAAPAKATTPAEFERRTAAAIKGEPTTQLPTITVHVDAGTGAEVSKWRAVEVTGVDKAPAGLLPAITSRVRVSGIANDMLRYPEGRPLFPAMARYRESLPAEAQAKFDAEQAAELAKRNATGAREVAALDRAMAQSHLSADAVVWRTGRPYGVTLPEGSAVGLEWTDPAYVGTTSESALAASFAAPGRVELRILAPKGTPAITIAGPGEDEILLGRDLRFRVIGDTRDARGGRHLDVEIVPKSAPAKAAPAKKAAAPKATTPAAFDRQAAGAATGQEALTAPKFRMTDPTDTAVRPGRPSNPEARAVYDAVRSYRRGGSNRIGVLLRGGQIDASRVAVTREAIAGIDKAMVGSALDRDVVVWRGQPGGFGLDLSRRDLAGFQWTDPAFVGTSAKRAAAQSFAEGGDAVLMRVVAPRGTRAVQLSGMDTEAEILLDRGLTYRVVADHGVVDGKRLLDVEVVPKSAPTQAAAKAAPAKKAATPRVPKAPEPAKMSLPALRTELDKVMERAGATVDLASVPKQALAEMVTRARTLPAAELKAEVGRWRQVVIDRRRDVADLLSQADQLLDAEATAAVLGQRGASIVRRWEQAAQGWPDLVEARKVVAAMQTGDPAKIRRAIAAARKKLGLEQIGADAGTVARYDAKVMTPIGGKIPADAHVVVVRPGYRMADGTVLSKPVVEEATAQEVAAAGGLRTGAAALEAASVPLRTAAERTAYSAYVSEYRYVNAVLRENGGVIPAGREFAKDRRLAAGLDSAMKRSALPNDIEVYRLTGTAEFEGGVPRVGMEWIDHGYVSTSVNPKMVGRDDRVSMRIVVPKGTHAVATSELDVGEVLLDRGLTFRVIADHGLDASGVRRIDVEVVPRRAS